MIYINNLNVAKTDLNKYLYLTLLYINCWKLNLKAKKFFSYSDLFAEDENLQRGILSLQCGLKC